MKKIQKIALITALMVGSIQGMDKNRPRASKSTLWHEAQAQQAQQAQQAIIKNFPAHMQALYANAFTETVKKLNSTISSLQMEITSLETNYSQQQLQNIEANNDARTAQSEKAAAKKDCLKKTQEIKNTRNKAVLNITEPTNTEGAISAIKLATAVFTNIFLPAQLSKPLHNKLEQSIQQKNANQASQIKKLNEIMAAEIKAAEKQLQEIKLKNAHAQETKAQKELVCTNTQLQLTELKIDLYKLERKRIEAEEDNVKKKMELISRLQQPFAYLNKDARQNSSYALLYWWCKQIIAKPKITINSQDKCELLKSQNKLKQTITSQTQYHEKCQQHIKELENYYATQNK